MRRWLSWAVVIVLPLFGTAHGACKDVFCGISDGRTVLATGQFGLCDLSNFDGVLTFSVPDGEVTEVSMHGALFSDPSSQWSIALSRPVSNRVQVDVLGLSEEQARFIAVGGGTIRIVTTSHPEGISGTLDSAQPITDMTWSVAKCLFR